MTAPEPLPPALAQPLVLALAADLTHQHSRVRLASLHALHALVQGGLPLAVMEEAVLPAVRPLPADHAPGVRAALFSCAAQWSGCGLAASGGGDDEGRAANQCRTLLPLLLPLVLLGLTDDAEAIRSTTYMQLEALGALMAGKPGSASSAPAATGQLEPLPGYCHPFTAGPPSAAARRLVQAALPRLLGQALAELREWTGACGLPGACTGLPAVAVSVSVESACSVAPPALFLTLAPPPCLPAVTLRALAARLLRAALIYGEEEVLPLLPTVVQALRTAVADEDAGGPAWLWCKGKFRGRITL